MPDTLRLGTLNIFGHHGPWERRRTILTEGLRRLDVDIIALQEVIHDETHDTARDILGDGYHIAHQTQGKLDASGFAIASRWPFERVHEVELDVPTQADSGPTVALVSEVDAPSPFGPVLFATYPSEYRPPRELERERQAVAVALLLETLAPVPEQHVILAGDMNADPDNACMRFWTGRQSLEGMSTCYRDAWESVHPGEPCLTFTPENGLMGEANWDWPFRQIDHILVRCSTHGLPTLLPQSCERIFTEQVDGTWASDHYGVIADVAIPPHPETT